MLRPRQVIYSTRTQHKTDLYILRTLKAQSHLFRLLEHDQQQCKSALYLYKQETKPKNPLQQSSILTLYLQIFLENEQQLFTNEKLLFIFYPIKRIKKIHAGPPNISSLFFPKFSFQLILFSLFTLISLFSLLSVVSVLSLSLRFLLKLEMAWASVCG